MWALYRCLSCGRVVSRRPLVRALNCSMSASKRVLHGATKAALLLWLVASQFVHGLRRAHCPATATEARAGSIRTFFMQSSCTPPALRVCSAWSASTSAKPSVKGIIRGSKKSTSTFPQGPKADPEGTSPVLGGPFAEFAGCELLGFEAASSHPCHMFSTEGSSLSDVLLFFLSVSLSALEVWFSLQSYICAAVLDAVLSSKICR